MAVTSLYNTEMLQHGCGACLRPLTSEVKSHVCVLVPHRPPVTSGRDSRGGQNPRIASQGSDIAGWVPGGHKAGSGRLGFTYTCSAVLLVYSHLNTHIVLLSLGLGRGATVVTGSQGRCFVLGRERISGGLLLVGVVIPKLNVNILSGTGGHFR